MLVGLDLGQVAQPAEVDAEQRNRRTVEQADCAQHRAVASEAQHQVGGGGRILAGQLGKVELGGVGVRNPCRVAVLAQPRRRL